jgi:hypothetical protein
LVSILNRNISCWVRVANSKVKSNYFQIIFMSKKTYDCIDFLM